jgi:NAD(P)-dependent dehydrogenase (short-subunit alcohol dehydrogenase family)
VEQESKHPQHRVFSGLEGGVQTLAGTEEGGAAGIRVNSVLPDAVLSGSAIWNGTWREERARAYGIKPDELEEFYRKRTTLRVNVFPEDIAEAVYYFTSPASSKTTGGVLTVDGGVPAAYVR